MLLRLLLGLIILALPFSVGCIFRFKSLSLSYLMGQFLMWAVFQLVAVPMIQLRVPFACLFWIYTGLVAGLAVWGIINSRRMCFEKPEFSIFLIPALLVVFFQTGMYIFGMHLDQDDARWIAEANDALTKNVMLLHNPADGEYIGRLALGDIIKDAFSPWSVYIAWLSGFTGIRPAIMAHTVYPPILLSTCYCAYYNIGRQLFQKKTERDIFLLMVSVINLFMAGNGYTQSEFSLVRIWQGKAVVAAVLIPSILLLILLIQKEDRICHWLLLASIGCAGCLMSGMGIVIGFLMIAIYGGWVIVCRRWKRIPLWVLSMIPSIAFGAGHFFSKG